MATEPGPRRSGAAETSAPDDPFPAEAPEVPWPDGRRAGGTLCWTGVAGLRLDLGGTAVAFDPFLARPGLLGVLFRRAVPATAACAARFAGLSAVFVGHAHYDHAMDLPAVAAASPEATVHGGPTVAALARRLGVPAERVVEVRDGDRFAVGPFRIEAVASAHGKVPLAWLHDRRSVGRRGPRRPVAYPRGEVFAWRVEAGGRSFHVQGSAGIEPGPLERQGPVDALVACLAARRGTPRYLERLADRLAPRLLVPLHHDDLFRPLSAPPRPVLGLDWPGFRRDAEALAARHGTRPWCPARGRPAAW